MEDLLPLEQYLNRELSWLDFNERVLALAEDPLAPLLERAKFAAIFASNLDEFYMVRVAGLRSQLDAGLTNRSADGLTPAEQLKAISERVEPMVRRHAALFVDELRPALAKEGLEIFRWSDLEDQQKEKLEEVFRKKIFPVLTPLAVDPGHPFPYISNLSLNLAVLVRDPSDASIHFARVKVPPLLPRFVKVEETSVMVPIEDVIAANLQRLFRGMDVVESYTFRVTRNADLEVDDDEADDLLQALEQELRKRRFSPAVRLEIEASMPDHLLELLRRELQAEDEDVHKLPAPLDLTALWEIYDLNRPELKYKNLQQKTPAELTTADDRPSDIFSVIKERDILVHHPYDSFKTTVQHFIESAATDPDVLAIKQTLYRTSGESPIVDSLIQAAQSGKQVVVLVEIKARFDEQANIGWARTLERAGCHVVYGLVGLKTHCKLALVVRQEGDRLQRYVHVGTGNYNPSTARVYEDLGLLTSDPQITNDVNDLFNYLTGYSRRPRYRSLIVAPDGMREKVISLIEREALAASEGQPARVILKLNSLVDEAVIDALYSASQAGVQIDLIVRGICALRPGVVGLSEAIRARSILGRFLEHSRVFYFHNAGDPDIFIGSADMMHRNLDRRVEVLVRLRSPEIMRQITSLLELALMDDTSAWALDSEGQWKRVGAAEDSDPIGLQEELIKRSSSDA